MEWRDVKGWGCGLGEKVLPLPVVAEELESKPAAPWLREPSFLGN